MIMNLYFELLKTPVFRIEDIDRYYHNMNSARAAVKRLMKEGLAVKIRNNLYTCISGETGAPVAGRFQIASAINKTSFISHHTAMEYYGFADQIFYDVYVSSAIKFNEFMFEGYTYHFIKSDMTQGIDRPAFSGGIAVTDAERTIIDSIKDMDKIAGPEEVIANISALNRTLKEEKLLDYLSFYRNQFLYQKTGFLLEPDKERLGLTDAFFVECQKHIGKSSRYLTREKSPGTFSRKWSLVIPDNMYFIKNGVNENADL